MPDKPNKSIKGSLSGIVAKMNATYHGLIGKGFSPGVGHRVMPVMFDNAVVGWKMQRQENDAWVDLEDGLFDNIEELIAFYKQSPAKTDA